MARRWWAAAAASGPRTCERSRSGCGGVRDGYAKYSEYTPARGLLSQLKEHAHALRRRGHNNPASLASCHFVVDAAWALGSSKMYFCPPCGNMLQLESVGNHMRFYCQTCPYIYTLRTVVSSEVPLEHKAVDDVLGGPEAWKNADQTDAVYSCLSPRTGRVARSQHD